ncbi:efflux RND transporter periplasmic adaptor subunit [Legionella massiliensis]|nr:efflux RND transporter periplasmic adaptor subunit [Legionella massiliensis]
MNSDKQTKNLKLIIPALVVILLAYWLIKHFSTESAPALPLPSVVTQKPVTKNIAEYVTQTGNMVAFNSVNLVARIKGYLEAVEFTDGSFVKKGKELFIIEPQPYLEQLKEAQATVVAQKASYDYTKTEYERQQRMYKQNATSLNNVQKWSSKTIETQAQIAEAVANEQVAAINYSYTHVLAPFDGRIGRHLVDAGNLVGNGEATALATIEQIDPIYVYFNLNELDLIKVRAAAHDAGFSAADINKVPVFVKMQSEQDFSHQGQLDFVNTGLNASTGTIEFRALLKNKDHKLLPGLFVQVRIPISRKTAQLTIPDTAIQYDQIGPYVYTLEKDNYVKLTRVTLGTLEQDTRAILKGLSPQDEVIVSGVQNATPGNQVAPVKDGNKQQ